MKHTIKSIQKRITGGDLYTVESTPNWFERVFLKRRPITREFGFPKRIARNKATVAILLAGYLKSK